MNLEKYKFFPLVKTWYSVFSVSLVGAWLTTASVVQASDLQIYAVPTAGKKTIVMMLDTSGSMGPIIGTGYSLTDDYGITSCTTQSVNSTTTPVYSRNYCAVSAGSTAIKVTNTSTGCEKQTDNSYRCYDRLTRLKDGMFAFLNSTDPTLNNVLVGLGNFSSGGDGKSGQILVPAAALGSTTSAQRTALKTALATLTASNGTPTAHAYAEAASYLMGTNTTAGAINLNNAPVYFNYGGSNSAYWATCYGWNSGATSCANWQNTSTVKPSTVGLTGKSCSQPISDQGGNTFSGTCYYGNQSPLMSTISGFSKSVSSSKSGTNYISPLPAVADRQSCDGQGIYILTDGAANASSQAIAGNVMQQALTSATFTPSAFSCPTSGGLQTSDSTAAYNCMGAFAQRLFDRTQNPANVSIQTAMVGFGASMNGLSADYTIAACKLSSRTQSDRNGDDACSPNQPTNALQAPGYGNGGFFQGNQSADVTNSVIAFINNLSKVPLNPLTTGTISVPYDALNPNGLQPYGYLRALEPNPANQVLTWRGNLKKYNVVLSGTNAGAFNGASGGLVYDNLGNFNAASKDAWNTSDYADGGVINLGGAYSQVPMPANGQVQTYKPDGTTIANYYYPASVNLRNLFTDAASVTSGNIDPITATNTSLLKIPNTSTTPSTSATTLAAYVLGQFDPSTGQAVLKDFPLAIKLNLLNYLGYPLDTTATTFPTSLATPNAPYLSMGGSIHSFPVQLTYSGTLDANGNLTTARSQSILYGSMEGGIHVVNASTGVEQMVFIPSSMLNDGVAVNALKIGTSSSVVSPYQGMDGNWVTDPAYNITTNATTSTSSVTAKQMNVYGGMRMGGSSYYGLDVLNPSSPKLLFRVGSDLTDYARMGQSWSKPVLANIRYNNQIKRVMIVGGGYDQCYENPNFKLNSAVSTTEFPDTSCNNKASAQGNAIYIIDAKTGARLWWASNTGANTNNSNMVNSIVSRISTLDRDGDGLVDHLYFGDLGGQVFRVDLNNAFGTSTANFGVRVSRLANLATVANDGTTNNGYTGTAYTGVNAPRFYEPPTVTIHDQGANTFILVGMASGNRSTPLDVAPTVGRDGMLPSAAVTRPTNNVYGILDRDFIKLGLITGSPAVTLQSQDSTFANFVQNPQTLTSGTVISKFFPSTGAGAAGWFRSLSSTSAGAEQAGANGIRVLGGLKAFEEPIAITNNLMVSVYDPEGKGVSGNDPCQPRVVGETDWQQYCLPYGVCLRADGTTNMDNEGKTGFKVDSTGKNGNVLGSGIRGITMVPTNPTASTTNSCGAIKIAGNLVGSGEWQCTSHFVPTRWFQRYR